MGVVGADKAIVRIMTWSDRGDWRDRRETVVEDHLDPVATALDLAPDEIMEAAGDEAMRQIIAFAFEDFLTCDFEPDQQNVVDDYLAHRGAKESAQVRDYLRALRSLAVGLYEVTETVAGSHFPGSGARRRAGAGRGPARLDERGPLGPACRPAAAARRADLSEHGHIAARV